MTITVKDILPPPFEWIQIPTGRVTLITYKGYQSNYIARGASQTFDVPSFTIAKYPITNAQYAKFIEADGYNQRKWWTDAGWEARAKGWKEAEDDFAWVQTNLAWSEPSHWRDEDYAGANHPVAGVSWYEAIAFCYWLTESSGCEILLPTEQQWQRASQGDDNREYPWGDIWDINRCNSASSAIGRTTPVNQYEGLGDSPYKVVDMTGNLDEWCLTSFETGSNEINSLEEEKAVRGGHFFTYEVGCTTSRAGEMPYARADGIGFRIVLESYGNNRF